MKLPKNESKDFEIAPAGNHMAVCYKVIDLGTQEVTWQGNLKSQRKILIGWELAEELMSDGRPFSVTSRYTFSTYERAKFRQHLESWRGKPFAESDFGPEGFDVRNLIGVGCLLNLIHNESDGRTYANISSIAKLPKGTKAPELVNESIYFSFDEPDVEVYNSLPERTREVIEESPEWEAWNNGRASAATPETEAVGDEVPF